MTQEQKDLLIKDLCSRLPYGVKVHIQSWNQREKEQFDDVVTLQSIDRDGYIKTSNEDYDSFNPEEVKPYLFPLSSATEEQKNDLIKNLYSNIFVKDEGISFWNLYTANMMDQWKMVFEWCVENHFDICGLIPMGLANDATGLNIY